MKSSLALLIMPPFEILLNWDSPEAGMDPCGDWEDTLFSLLISSPVMSMGIVDSGSL